jgi:hypothetical protein
MIAAADFITIPYTPDMTQAGIKYACCFSRIKPLSLLTSGGTSTLRRYFEQKTTSYLQL